MIEKCFFGCNTAYGFYSFFDFFTEPEEGRIMILKGGPGTGKSTLIKRIADVMVEKGYKIELQFCSLDCNFLDALAVPAIKIAVVAGTGHHIMDPKYPGAVDEIINLGSYCDVNGIRAYRHDIVAISKEIDRAFRKIYRYLRAAKLIRDNIEDINAKAQSFSSINKITESIITRILKSTRVADVIGKERHLFASSITPDGYISYIDTMIKRDTDVYAIIGDYGTGKSTMMKRIGDAANIRGFLVKYYHSPLNPDKIEHLMLPELNILITSEEISSSPTAVYNLNEYLSDVNEEEILIEREKYEAMIHEAIRNLREAKKLHLELEKYYTPNMDFEGVNKCRRLVLRRILEYE